MRLCQVKNKMRVLSTNIKFQYIKPSIVHIGERVAWARYHCDTPKRKWFVPSFKQFVLKIEQIYFFYVWINGYRMSFIAKESKKSASYRLLIISLNNGKKLTLFIHSLSNFYFWVFKHWRNWPNWNTKMLIFFSVWNKNMLELQSMLDDEYFCQKMCVLTHFETFDNILNSFDLMTNKNDSFYTLNFIRIQWWTTHIRTLIIKRYFYDRADQMIKRHNFMVCFSLKNLYQIPFIYSFSMGLRWTHVSKNKYSCTKYKSINSESIDINS